MKYRLLSQSNPPAWLAAAILALSIGVVYCRALDAPFIFDDRLTIFDNPSIVSLWPLMGIVGSGPLNPPPDLPTSTRPLVNLSFALNYALGGLNPVGYHALNVFLHFCAALLVWAIVRRTLQLPFFRGQFANSAGWVALVVATLWALHPLATETVIYTTQRTELMMALCYLATLYCSLRYWTALPRPLGEGRVARDSPWRGEGALELNHNHRVSSRRAIWLTLAVLTCLAGMASKESMVSAPLIVLLFERTFIAGSLKEAWRRSWRLYAGLAATWLVLLIENLRPPFGTSAGFGLGLPAYVWWLTQTKVLLMYLKLVVWPWPLLIHYEVPYLTTFAQAWMYVVSVLLLVIATLSLLWRNHPIGFLLTCVFAILSPTLLVPIILETAADRRMYLPLAVILATVVVGVYVLGKTIWTRRATRRTFFGGHVPSVAAAIPALVIAIVFGLLTATRLAAYHDEMDLWREVLRFQSDSFMAHNTMGQVLINAGRLPEAIDQFRAILRLKPDEPISRNQLTAALNDARRLAEENHDMNITVAMTHHYPSVFNNLGVALTNANRLPEAADAFQTAVELNPDFPSALNNLGLVLMRVGRTPQAIAHLEHAVDTKPSYAEAHSNLGNALLNVGRLPEAIDHFQAALRLMPNHATVLNNLAIALAREGRYSEAIKHLERLVQLNPQNGNAHNNLGSMLARSGQPSQAMEQFRLALELNKDDANAHYNMGDILASTGKLNEAMPHLEEAVRLRPDSADMHFKLANGLRLAGRHQEAIDHYQAAIKLKPDLMPAYESLAQTYTLANQPEKAIATTERALEVARASGQKELAQKIEGWLKKNRKPPAANDADSSHAPQPSDKKPPTP